MITGLTSLRGIAAILVVIFHYHLFVANILPKSSAAIHIVEKLYLMVDLFFILSGFVIYHVYGRSFTHTFSMANFRQFIVARFARIYPLHIFSLLLMLLLYGLMRYTQTFNSMFSVNYDLSALLPQLFLAQALGLHSEATWNSPSWSISVEWWANMCFPLLVALMLQGKRWGKMLALVMVVVGYLAIIFHFQPEFWRVRWALFGVPESVPIPMHMLDITTGAALLRCLCGFILGMLIYDGYHYLKTKGWFNSGNWSLCCLLTLLFGWSFELLNDVFAVLVFTLLVLNISANQGKMERFLEIPALKYLGELSYSLYLLHMPVLFAYIGIRRILVPNDVNDLGLGYKMALLDAWALAFLLIAISLLLSALSFRYLENPARRLIKVKLQSRKSSE
ncbi:acyltransferase [Paraglaciecola sp.]|uniref:acyltransferase family protein n=1 Tax=Paraglaciecola sp. TaxID=1920173 RepID=UPI0030F3BA2B